MTADVHDPQDGGDLYVYRTIAGRVQVVMPEHPQRDWDDYTRLKWLAATVSRDTKTDVRVYDSSELDQPHPQPDIFGIVVGREDNPARFTFAEAWKWLDDFRAHAIAGEDPRP